MKALVCVRMRVLVTASLAAVMTGAGLYAPPAAAAPAARAVVLRSVSVVPGDDPPAVQPPPLVTEIWNGSTGVVTTNERWRNLVADIAEFAEEPEIRDAALAALATGDPVVIERFAMVGQPELEQQVLERQRRTAAENLAKVKAMDGTGVPGGYFNAGVKRVLAGSDSDREAFLAYGADIARERDAQVGAAARDRAAALRERVRLVAAAAVAGSQVRQAAEAALAGDDAAVAAFLNGGYLAAANADAQAREQYLKDLEARNKAAEDLSDLAQRAARASEARQRLLAAHGDGVRSLQQAANAMAATANAARHSQRVLAGSTSVQDKATELVAANDEAKRQVGYVGQAAERAAIAARLAGQAADTLIETGLTYGAEWSLIAQGMSEAATAAVGAATTAQHAIDATIATNNAQGAQALAEAHARQAEQWRVHAQQHAAAAKKLAVAASKQADAAKTAAARTRQAREQAQAAEAAAWAAAGRTRQHRQTAEARAAEAKAARQVAEQERANAARHRADAEGQAAAARSARADAEAQGRAAAAALGRANAADAAAGNADDEAWKQEDVARRSRDAAMQAERDEQAAKAKAQALRSAVAAAASGEAKAEAQRQADEAAAQAGVAGNGARAARSSAHAATGAAANARASAVQAQAAADRAWAAAEKARAAAAAAAAAADKAEASAKTTHAARVRADAKAAVATSQQTKAAEAARATAELARQAADEAVQALWAANRTQQEAQAATTEAVAAAAQADIAVTAAAAAAASSAGIAQPYNTALGVVSPFTGADIDADFVTQVAEQARTIGAEQAAAAQARAEEATTAAQRAETAAQAANAQVKPAYDAAAAAARDAANAAASAAEAKQAAAQAAADGAAARAAAAGAGRADAQARADAIAARQASNEAANDAAIAGRNAAAAQHDADQANNAATAAEADAAAARAAATRAETDAAAARQAADSAQNHADSAAAAANTALQHSIEAQKAAERAEDAERKRLDNAAAGATPPLPPGENEEDLLKELTPEEQEQYREAKKAIEKSVIDFIKEEAGEIFDDLTDTGDLEACFEYSDPEACLWTLVDLTPAKALRTAGLIAKLAPKLRKFLAAAKDARRKIDQLRELAKRNKTTCPPKPNSVLPETPALRADRTSKPIADRTTGAVVLTASLTTSAGTAVQVSAVQHRTARPRVHNPTGVNLHAFYVMASTSVFVFDAPCPPIPKITPRALEHSFDRHAEQWFGRPVTRSAKMDEWKGLIDRTRGSSQVVPWSSGQTLTNAYLARIDGRWFVAQFDRSSGDLVTAFVPNNGQVSAMLKLLGK